MREYCISHGGDYTMDWAKFQITEPETRSLPRQAFDWPETCSILFDSGCGAS